MSKPKLSKAQDIARRFRYDNREVTRLEIGEAARAIYDLLDLVGKMGKKLRYNGGYYVGCECTQCKETRALLEELKK